MTSILDGLGSMELFICENPLCAKHSVPDDEEWVNLRLRFPLTRTEFIVSKNCPKLKELIEKCNPTQLQDTKNLIVFEFQDV